jgi:branched-subunit amino acid transport protein
MDMTRVELILILGLGAFALRALPQMLFMGRSFPERWDRLLRYLSYALLCSLISTTLFMTGARFDVELAPHRLAALLAAIMIAHWTRSAVTGMLAGTALVWVLSWMRKKATSAGSNRAIGVLFCIAATIDRTEIAVLLMRHRQKLV